MQENIFNLEGGMFSIGTLWQLSVRIIISKEFRQEQHSPDNTVFMELGESYSRESEQLCLSIQITCKKYERIGGKKFQSPLW